MGDIFDDENEPTVTMKEYIEGVEAQELEADLVLGGDEGKECTFSNGYMKRQAVFSCLTCVPSGNAGVCTACSLTCHDGHEVIELWTRRQFRCDCGNKKFGDVNCKLLADKDPENDKNSYNQNYKGLYCVCHRPYPDPDGEDQGEMIQCCICEDWFHENHLGLESTEQIPKDDEGEPIYEDFVCQGCSTRCSFLSFYQEISIPPSAHSETSINIDPVKTDVQEDNFNKNDSERSLEAVVTTDSQLPNPSNDAAKECNQPKKPTVVNDTACVGCHSEQHNSVVLESHQSSPEVINMTAGLLEPLPSSCANKLNSIEGASISKKAVRSAVKDPTFQEINISGHVVMDSGLLIDQVMKGKYLDVGSCCKLRNRGDIPVHTGEKKKPLFLARNWREVLCNCKSCSDLCKAKGVSFLLDKGDTLEEYEKIAKQKREEKLQQQEGVEVAFLQNLGHTQQIELFSGINDMKNELHSFFESLGSARPVTGADIHQVFDNLKRKRKRLI